MSNTKVVRVSKDALERLTIPVPLPETQKEIADTMDAVDRQVKATSDEVARAQTARAALLDALLAHKIEVTPVDSDIES